jgi:outer membrane protein
MKKVVTILACVLSSLVFAQTDSSSVQILTFERAVQIGLQNGMLLNQQRNNLELSQMQKIANISAVLPSLSGTVTAQRYNGNSFIQQTGQVINGIRDNVSGSLNANMNIFSGFYRMNSIRQYTNALEAQSYFVKRTSQDLINTVATQYLNVMLDKELLKIAKENFNALDKQLQQVKEQVALGAKSPVDEYNQDATTKAAELRYVQAEIQLNNDKLLLAQTILIDPLEEFDVEQPNWDLSLATEESLNVSELADKAKEFRADYLRALKAETAQRFAMKASKGLMMPSLYGFFSYGSAYNFSHGVPKTLYDSAANDYVANANYPRPFGEQVRVNNLYKAYGFQLSIPIFNGLQQRTAYVQQKVLYENAQWTRKNAEMQIRNDIQRSVTNYRGAERAFIITTGQLKAAEIAYQLETERYNLGVTNFVEYSNANKVLVQAQTDKAQAEYRLVFQRVLLEYAVGTLKPEDLQAQTK